MFDRDSRYRDTKVFSSAARTVVDSEIFSGTRPRPIEPTKGVLEHLLQRGDRLDRLAEYYYQDPQKWWLILDANPHLAFGGDVDMGEYVGTTIVIPAESGRGGF